MNKTYFIPDEFKHFFEVKDLWTKILPPPPLTLPPHLEKQIEDAARREYSTFMLPADSPVKVEYYDQSVVAQINEWTEVPKPAYVIKVYEDTAKPWMRASPVEPGVFEVHVAKREQDLEEPNGPGSLLASWLHELGHVVAQIFNLPSARRDPRNRLGYEPDGEGDYYERMYHSEVEAWNLGEALLRFTRHRWDCLNSYREPLNPKMMSAYVLGQLNADPKVKR